jgi:lipopolysaccharide transport system ATP-binding protein
MSSDHAISVKGVAKVFRIYDRPKDRLIQGLYSLAARITPGAALKQRLRRRAAARARDFHALDDISFHVDRGETVGIIGRNGSGKSTLLQIICGTLNPTAGEVVTLGRVAALLELGSGFNPDYTGRENVYLNGQLLGLTRGQIDDRFEDIAAFADIGDFIDQPVKSYSSGMFVRLAFAVIAHVDADILVVDEALAVGDAFFTQKCMRFLREFMRTGTVLFVSHDTAAVKALCTRAVWLQNGRMIASGPAKAVCDRYLGEMIESSQGTDRQAQMQTAEPQHKPESQTAQEATATTELGTVCFLPFRADAAHFGAGGARIVAAQFRDAEGTRLFSVDHHNEVQFEIEVQADEAIQSPIVGFFVRDRLGQTLFGSNTFSASAHLPCHAGTRFCASFRFEFPALADGDYTISIAVADGTQQDHVQLHWIHDAMGIKTQGIGDIGGLVGLPMREVTLAPATSSTEQQPSACAQSI